MTNEQLYKKFQIYKKKHNLTYRQIAEKLKTSAGSVHDKLTRLKKGKSVYTDFLIKLEEALNDKIFFD